MQQQAIANAMAQKRLQDEEAYQQFDENDRTRSRNIAEGKDPDHPDRLITSELPSNLQVGVSPKASLQAQYDKNMKIAMFFMARGFKDQASPYLDAARSNAEQLNAQQTFQRDFAKAIVLANYTTNREMQAINARGQVEGALQGQREGFEAGLHSAPTYADLHPKTGSSKNVPTVGEVNSMLNEWSQGAQTQTGTQINPGGKPIPTYARVPPDPAQRTFVTSAISQIQHAKNPVAAATGAIAAYKKNFKNADPQAVRILQAAADEAGGSNVTSDPPPPQGWGQP
jgi:hypothetical protein